MKKQVVLEEFHLTVLAAKNLAEAKCRRLIRTIRSARFRAQLTKALQELQATYRSLNDARFRIDR